MRKEDIELQTAEATPARKTVKVTGPLQERFRDYCRDEGLVFYKAVERLLERELEERTLSRREVARA